jgi:hypothetical protein
MTLHGNAFQLEGPKDEVAFEWCKRDDELHYIMAKEGDQLQCPFLCDLCVFHTLRARR